MTPTRYWICEWAAAARATNAEEYEPYDAWDEASYLLDTKTNMIVFCDRMESEDATLNRDLRPLVDLLNHPETN